MMQLRTVQGMAKRHTRTTRHLAEPIKIAFASEKRLKRLFRQSTAVIETVKHVSGYCIAGMALV